MSKKSKKPQSNDFSTISPLDQEIQEAGMLSLERDEKAIIDAISRMKNLLDCPDLNEDQKLTIRLDLVRAYQRHGEHKVAIEFLESTETEMHLTRQQSTLAYMKHLRAISYLALGIYKQSCDLFEEALGFVSKPDADPRLRSIILLEAGKAFKTIGNDDRAWKYWKEASKIFSDNDDIEHYARARANMGFMLLEDQDESKQEKGIELIEEASFDKSRIGDLEGLANNYCNLGLYYWRKRQYGKAIAYTRKDLYLSRKVGDLRGLATTLYNLAAIYGDLKQLTSARRLLKEANKIGEDLQDNRLLAIVNHNLKRINETGKEAGRKKERIGRFAACACGSGKKYQDCCGQADFEPVDIPIQFGGISEDLEQIEKEIISAGGEPSRLDFILRETKQSKQRLCWSQIEIRDGWLKMSELPDMANHQLIAAKVLSDEAQAEPDSTIKPLSCIILSVSALEAYINQAAFFLKGIKDFYESRLHIVPPELSNDILDFQRHTELTRKWEILGRALCGNDWPPPHSLLTSFKNLVYIRNELVHFKAFEYEQVVPPAKIPNYIMRRVPKTVEIREIPHSWPFRLLTPSFSNWCVHVSDSMISYFKQSYIKDRKNV